MSIHRYFTTPITITNPGGATTIDAEGIPTTAGGTVETMGHVQPLSAQAAADLQLGVEVAERARLVWLPLDTEITYRSTVAVRGDRYEVKGDPKDWRVGSPNDHLELIVVRSLR